MGRRPQRSLSLSQEISAFVTDLASSKVKTQEATGTPVTPVRSPVATFRPTMNGEYQYRPRSRSRRLYVSRQQQARDTLEQALEAKRDELRRKQAMLRELRSARQRRAPASDGPTQKPRRNEPTSVHIDALRSQHETDKDVSAETTCRLLSGPASGGVDKPVATPERHRLVGESPLQVVGHLVDYLRTVERRSVPVRDLRSRLEAFVQQERDGLQERARQRHDFLDLHPESGLGTEAEDEEGKSSSSVSPSSSEEEEEEEEEQEEEGQSSSDDWETTETTDEDVGQEPDGAGWWRKETRRGRLESWQARGVASRLDRALHC